MIREKILFTVALFLFVLFVFLKIYEKATSGFLKEDTFVLDFSKDKIFSFEIKKFKKFIYIKLSKNPIFYFLLRKLIKKEKIIYITDEFKKSFLFPLYEKKYQKKINTF